MRPYWIALLMPTALVLAGCRSHLVFFEEDHLGLKAKFQPNDPSPAELSLGYHRGVVAAIPQQAKDSRHAADHIIVTEERVDGTNVVTVLRDPDDLMSLYTVFTANVGLGDPVQTRHFLATGSAAASLLADHEALRDVSNKIKDTTGNGGGQ